ncbi:MAG: SRPBCC family protein [Steroidobacteraceae bacterium]
MNSLRRSPRSGTRGYAHLVEVNVPISRVWTALTDPALMRVWSGQEAEIDARKGGLYRIGKRNAGGREAHIDIFDVDRRLRLIYLNGADEPPSDSAVVDDFLLDMRKDQRTTSLRVLGSGVPEAAIWDKSYVRMRLSWERFLARIKATLEAPPKPKKPPPPPKDPPLPGLDY